MGSTGKKVVLSISLLASNRKDSIRKCLDSLNPLLKEVSSELIIVDTGCDEEQHNLLLEYADKVICFEWCNDFSKARNVGLKQAKGEWFLYIDDDEWFEDVNEIIKFFKSGMYRKYGYANYIQRNYLDMDGEHYSDSWVSRMVRMRPGIHFESKIHEYMEPVSGACIGINAYVHHYGYVYKDEAEKRRHFERNKVLLLEMLEKERPDAVFINTPWELHARMAIDSMQSGAHAFVEVPLALTLDDLWAVVGTAERTQRHCMMLEEVTYGRNELMFLHMVRLGLIGDLLHGEAAYIHDLRERTMGGTPGDISWRAFHYADRNGNLYPTHGLAPVAQYMNIARGEDTFDRIVSLSSPSLGHRSFVEKTLHSQNKWNRTDFLCGDINTSIIQTKLGRTILVQWDESSPRPYDRKNLIQGTEGTLADFPLRVIGNFASSAKTSSTPDTADAETHAWYTGPAALEDLRSRFEHPLYRRLAEPIKLLTPRAAMDYLMLYRIVECLHQGLPTDQNVYEAALWSAVGPLSEKSVHEGGAPQLFPDFTRGDWKHTDPSFE